MIHKYNTMKLEMMTMTKRRVQFSLTSHLFLLTDKISLRSSFRESSEVEMKAFFVILLICFAHSNGKIIQTTFQSIEDFRAQNPNVKLIEMQVNDVNDSRSYSLGVRQTGEIFSIVLDMEFINLCLFIKAILLWRMQITRRNGHNHKTSPQHSAIHLLVDKAPS
jgi:hypothetical protein